MKREKVLKRVIKDSDTEKNITRYGCGERERKY